MVERRVRNAPHSPPPRLPQQPLALRSKPRHPVRLRPPRRLPQQPYRVRLATRAAHAAYGAGLGQAEAGEFGLGGAGRDRGLAEVFEGRFRFTRGKGEDAAGAGGRADEDGGPAAQGDLLAVVRGQAGAEHGQHRRQLGLESALQVQRRADLRQQDQRGDGPARRREAVDVGDAAEEQVRALGVLPGLAQGEGEPGPPDREVGVPLDVAGQVGGEQFGQPPCCLSSQ